MWVKRFSVSVLAIFGLLTAGAGAAEVSRANRLLFLSDQLAPLGRQTTLYYELRSHGGEDGQSFTDRIVMRLKAPQSGSGWDASFDYLSGERRRYVPPENNVLGNPIIKIFLQRQVVEMQRHTGGSWRYFQKAVKRALADSGTVAPASFEFQGKKVRGTRIAIEPYQGDPSRERIGDYASVRYVFLLSEKVPGMVYRMKAVLPRAASSEVGDDPPRGETLTLQRVEETDHRTRGE